MVRFHHILKQLAEFLGLLVISHKGDYCLQNLWHTLKLAQVGENSTSPRIETWYKETQGWTVEGISAFTRKLLWKYDIYLFPPDNDFLKLYWIVVSILQKNIDKKKNKVLESTVMSIRETITGLQKLAYAYEILIKWESCLQNLDQTPELINTGD